MRIQTVKHSVSKVAGLMAIASTAALFSLPALAGVGEAVHKMDEKPQTTSQEVPATPVSPATEIPTTTTPSMTTEPMTPAPTTTTPSMTTEPMTPAPTTTTPSMTTEPMTPAPTSKEPKTSPQAAASGNIVDVASSNSSFKTLTKALKAAGLTQTLSGKGPYTVFAPTDAAFAALPEGTVDKLMQPENKEVLKKILSYHVVSGEVDAVDLKTGKVETVEGAAVEVSVDGSSLMVNDANVTKSDIKATNGVIHAIDKVILPPEM